MTTNYSHPPRLESTLATVGILGIAALSCWLNAGFWWGRGDQVAAGLTVGAHLVAVGGFSMFLHHLHGARWLAAGAAVVTLIAAGWCAASMFEKLNAEAHARAVAAVEASPAQAAALADLASARSLLQIEQYRTAPSDIGPVGRREWGISHRAEVAVLMQERDRAQARIDALTPKEKIDPLALARGVGVEVACLIGLAVFGFGFGRRKAPEPAAEPEKPSDDVRVVDMREAARALGRASGQARRAKASAH